MKPLLNLAGRDLSRSGRLLLLLCIGVGLFAYLLASTYPAFKERMEAAGRHAPAFVKRLLEARTGGLTFESYVTLAYVHPVALVLMTVWPVSRAARAVAGEVERGTLTWKLAYPIGRVRFVLGKAAVMLLGTATVSLALFVGFRVSVAWLRLPNAGPGPYLWAALGTFLLYGAIGALCLWVSAASSKHSAPITAGVVLTIGSFLLEFVGELVGFLQPYRWLSLYHYFPHQAILKGAPLGWQNAAVLGGLMLIGLAGATVTFSRRDLSI